MFHTTDSVGDCSEVVDAQFLLVLEAEWAVIGGDHAQIVGSEALPQVGVMVFGNATPSGVPWETVVKAFRRKTASAPRLKTPRTPDCLRVFRRQFPAAGTAPTSAVTSGVSERSTTLAG